MTKDVAVPIGVAVVGFIAGGIMLGSIGVSAETSDMGRKHGAGHRGAVVAEVLDVTVEELKDVKDSDTTFEEFVVEQGFADMDAFQTAVEDYLTEKWTEEGVSEEEIAERIANMREKQEVKEAILDVRAQLLGVSVDELRDLRGDKESISELIEAAGYEDREAFREAIEAELEKDGIELPEKHGHHRGMHR